MEAEVPDAALLQRQLDAQLAVLRAVPGVTAVTDYPAGGVGVIVPNDPNKNGVRFKLQGKLVNVHFNAATGIDNKVAAAAQAIKKLTEKVGEGVMREAAASVLQPPPEQAATASLTDAEEQWLADWYDEQPEPDQVTLAQADAALAAHRAAAGGSSLAALDVIAFLTSQANVIFEDQVGKP